MPVLQKEAKIVPEGKDSSDQEGDQSGDQTNQQQGGEGEGGGEGEQTEQAGTEQGETSSVPVPDNRTAAGEGEGVEKEPEFPVDVLTSLDEQLNRPRWVVPVLPKSDLEQLLEASIKLAKAGNYIQALHAGGWPPSMKTLRPFAILHVAQAGECGKE